MVLSGIYFLIWRLWIFLYDHHILPTKRVPCFVVSIGNLTVGGTGKTPMTIFLAQQYQTRGRRVGIVSRGYRGCYKEPVAVVSDGQTIFELAPKVGDEPILMAQRLDGVPIVVARDRFSGCQWLIDHFKTDLILLDDGFQHLRLHRDLNILLMDTTQTNRSLLPKGPMREPLSAAQRADRVILTRQETPQKTFTLLDATGYAGPILHAAFVPAALIHPQTGVGQSVSELKGKRICAVCGIGNPNPFVKMLDEQGAVICETLLFRDHFNYTAATLRAIEEKRRIHGAEWVVTTEKDAVKIAPLLTRPSDIWAVRIDVAFFDPHETLERLLFQMA